MKTLSNWIRVHQIVTFFIITFGFSWGLGFSFDAVMNQGAFLMAPFASIAICGPALAGIIVTGISNTQPGEGTRRARWIAFFVAWVLSALVFQANNTFINHAPFALGPMIGSAVISAPVAFVISAAYGRNPGVKRYLNSLISLRGVWSWASLGLVFVPALALISLPISELVGRSSISSQHLPDLGLTLIGLVAVKFLYQMFFFNATGEETGWRGFALPRLQAQTSPLVAGLVLALFWAPWHFFPWQAEGSPVFDWHYWVKTYYELIPATLIIVWICNRARGSILVAGITHAAANTAFAFLPEMDWTVFVVINYIVVLVLIWIDRMWRALPPDHPAVIHASVEKS